jgi:MFS family permease
LAIFTRFAFLDRVPNAINVDELHYTIDAKSFFLTGKDVLGEVTPIDVLLFHSPKSEPLQAELQYFLEMPMVGFFGFSLLNIVLPNAILSVLTVLLIYLITLRLFNKKTALIAGFIASISPWLIFVGRTTYEAGPATLFFLCTFYVLLITKEWKILLTIPFMLLAFYSYIGTKLIFLPFMLISLLYCFLYVNKRKYLTQYSLVFIFSILLTLFFLFQFKQYQVSRVSEVLLPNNPEITRQVIEFRKLTLGNPLLGIFENKFTVYSSVLLKNTFNAFSPSYLFVNADFFFMMGGQGLFYFMDVIFLIIGIFWMFLHNRKMLVLFAAMIFTGIVPQILHDPNGTGNFTPHIALIIPIFIILIGVGIDKIFNTFKQKKYAYLFIAVLTVLYLAVFINFSYFYIFKFPLQEATFEDQNHVLAKYISLYKNTKSPIFVYTQSPAVVFKEYIFYANSYNLNTANMINDALKKNTLTLNNVSFHYCTDHFPFKSIVINDFSCGKQPNEGAISIAQFKDSGARFNIYGDRICSQYNLPHYISNLTLSDFNIENLSEKKFCETFIVSY